MKSASLPDPERPGEGLGLGSKTLAVGTHQTQGHSFHSRSHVHNLKTLERLSSTEHRRCALSSDGNWLVTVLEDPKNEHFGYLLTRNNMGISVYKLR